MSRLTKYQAVALDRDARPNARADDLLSLGRRHDDEGGGNNPGSSHHNAADDPVNDKALSPQTVTVTAPESTMTVVMTVSMTETTTMVVPTTMTVSMTETITLNVPTTMTVSMTETTTVSVPISTIVAVAGAASTVTMTETQTISTHHNPNAFWSDADRDHTFDPPIPNDTGVGPAIVPNTIPASPIATPPAPTAVAASVSPSPGVNGE